MCILLGSFLWVRDCSGYPFLPAAWRASAAGKKDRNGKPDLVSLKFLFQGNEGTPKN